MDPEDIKIWPEDTEGEIEAKRHLKALLIEVKWFYEQGIAIDIKPSKKGYGCSFKFWKGKDERRF